MTIIGAIGNFSLNLSETNTLNDVAFCEVCGDFSDGYHYKIQACRSCTAFIRRCVTFNKKYRCRFSNNCQIDFRNRNTCKGCRYNKCLMKGMDTLLVQPKREPTGSQPYRKKREMKIFHKEPNEFRNISFNNENISESEPSTSNNCKIQNSTTLPNIVNFSTLNSRQISNVPLPSTSEIFLSSKFNNQYFMTPFYKCVEKYLELQKFNTHLSVPFPHFLIDNMKTPPPLRIFTPSDVDLLCRTQMSNLFSWLSSIDLFGGLSSTEKISLTKRFSLKKINLDTIVMTSKYPEQMNLKCIVLENYTIIPPNMTGFEKDDDTEGVRSTRLAIFRPSINDTFESLIKPISKLKLTEYEIVTLYILLFWSKHNEKLVTNDKVKFFEKKRNWIMKCLYTHYCKCSIDNSEVRLGEIMLLLNELEWNCINNYKDYLVSQLFNLGILKTKWFDKFCYSSSDF